MSHHRTVSALPPPDWLPIATAPHGVTVETKIDDAHGARNVERLQRQGRQWFLPNLTAYVYYSPTHWREARP